ncbi:type II toxin-antitoxin system CcdA family antitoxin [Enterobacter sp. 04-C-01-SI_S15]|uniref:Type II toxin-antitoxin system CcdA family antitoxin n=2 Tax=Enterobacteriaceae TaxID=543 RepID=A0ABV4JFZ4_9ENTR|nr:MULTISPECIES: type II toxin-antitoxin system CcdA family antitoxin [Enterobacter]MCK7280228.1 type II toxin-antitoxin system CcdA family antitoxin [Enterobacter chengduensis]MCM7422540.1 type II toxin-antitoxin system CcdA family antitoxin [Enterobacter chengduensis]MDL0065392.1 type II toxin-antitoxin system CcdA family antitoxin [Enterobacter chengduensis]MDV0366150.1 type II toxin-antitoxin system CcdA family antitoxin [Enterobacter chengduensis]MDY0422485.1 type II toxin-antitoxin syste
MMKHTAETKPGQNITSRKPLCHAEQRSARRHRPSKEDRAFIQAMNEFVEKHGTITDDEFFRVI